MYSYIVIMIMHQIHLAFSISTQKWFLNQVYQRVDIRSSSIFAFQNVLVTLYLARSFRVTMPTTWRINEHYHEKLHQVLTLTLKQQVYKYNNYYIFLMPSYEKQYLQIIFIQNIFCCCCLFKSYDQSFSLQDHQL